jgi:hypothetical protein
MYLRNFIFFTAAMFFLLPTMVSYCQEGALVTQLIDLSGSEINGPLIWEEIATDTNGNALHMSNEGSEKYCRAQGARLPNARELALHAQSLGARGIRETAFPDVSEKDAHVSEEMRLMHGDGFIPIERANSAHQLTVDFYYNKTGYKPPQTNLGLFFIWGSAPSGLYPVIMYSDGSIGVAIGEGSEWGGANVTQCVQE